MNSDHNYKTGENYEDKNSKNEKKEYDIKKKKLNSIKMNGVNFSIHLLRAMSYICQ